MTFAALAVMIETYGPTVIPILVKIYGSIADGKGAVNLTAEDWAELARLCALHGADIYAKLGIALPPPAPAPDYQQGKAAFDASNPAPSA
jgi:hypothetical protein